MKVKYCSISELISTTYIGCTDVYLYARFVLDWIMLYLRAQPKRMLIIGGGPCGLVVLRTLEMSRGTSRQVQLVERQDDVGGTAAWCVAL
jgi:NADPH-dependent 2,4-dienoyl-CoA reductase/sulfur reductase-like enzyme